MNKGKESKWTNIRALKTNVSKWTKFLEINHLGSLPAYVENLVNAAIAKEKKRLK